MAKKAKELLRLYTVKHGAVKEMFTTEDAANRVALANNAIVSLTTYMERPDRSVYTVVTKPDEE